MEILVQKNLIEPASRKVFAKISTEVLNLEDVVQSLSEIIDDEKLRYYKLPFMSGRSESVQRLDVYTSLRRERADRSYVVSNGKNTIYMLDYVVKTQRIYHDPILCIVGPEAEEIAQLTLNNLSKLLLSKTYYLKFDSEAIKEFSNLLGYKKEEVVKNLSETFEEAEIALKMKLLKEHRNNIESPTLRIGTLSKEIIEDVKRKRPLSAEPLDPWRIIPFGIIMMLMILLLVVLTRL